MSSAENEQALWDASAQAWLDRLPHDVARLHLLDPIVIDLIENSGGKKVLDVGCGEGRMCRTLAGRGFETVGIDPTVRFIEEARRQDPEGTYLLSGGEEIPLADEAFDIALAYLVLIDIPDFRRAIGEMVRVLKPGGHLVVVNLTSCNTAGIEDGWVKDESGNKLYFPIDNYMEEHPNRVAWCGIEVINHHRPLQSYMQIYLSHRLRLIDFIEPTPTPEALAQFPSLGDTFRLPFFDVMRWRKTTN